MDTIQKWKEDPTVERIKDSNGNMYGIRVIGRGEDLFFQENEKALLCVIDAIDSIIYVKSIKNWEGEKKMNEAEKNRVLALIKYYYKIVYKSDLHVA